MKIGFFETTGVDIRQAIMDPQGTATLKQKIVKTGQLRGGSPYHFLGELYHGVCHQFFHKVGNEMTISLAQSSDQTECQGRGLDHLLPLCKSVALCYFHQKIGIEELY